jgi:hypothetical protein
MGDEELNFTEEEAQSWADDPRNQPQNIGLRVGILIACVVLLIVLVIIGLINNFGGSTSRGGETQIGVLLVQ